jgi:hypothetical protein
MQVRETSRTSLVRPSSLLPAAKKSLDAVKRDFSDIILPGGLHDRVRSLAAAAANTKLHGAPYRHMLFYGGFTLDAHKQAACQAAVFFCLGSSSPCARRATFCTIL